MLKYSIPLCLFCWFVSTHALQAQNVCPAARDLIQHINQLHLEPHQIDDSLSSRIFDSFLNMLDRDRRYLTRGDSISLASFRYQIDDQLSNNSCSFITMASKIMNERVTRMQKFTDSLLSRPLNYTSRQYGSPFLPPRQKFGANYSELKQRHIAHYKHDILSRCWRATRTKKDVLTPAAFASLEPAMREKTRKAENTDYEKVLHPPGGYETLINTLLLKSIASSYDPHTEFFSAPEMERFETSLRTVQMSFGFELEENQMGQVQIGRLTPASPAWKSEALNEGDLIVELQWDSGPLIDVADMEADELSEQLEAGQGKEMGLTVRKQDGQLKTVRLKKEKIENTENLISSFVLEDNNLKVGYISLPGFYTTEQEKSGQGCAGDVAKEIIKLKKENIQGLILDLRFNGGGSLQEAIELAGIFVDAGPLAILEQKKEAVTLKDTNRGSVYSGPLLIMVNATSASASELVSAGLQDYNRAIIAGCPTFGKATGQSVSKMPGSTLTGFVKVTEDRLYRITGESLQLKGVVPNITYPDITEHMGYSEKTMDFVLTAKRISKKVYYNPLAPIELGKVSAASQDRIATSSYFGIMGNLIALMKKPVPLEFRQYLQFTSEFDSLISTLSEKKNLKNLKVYNSGLQEALLNVDLFHKEISDRTLKSIRESVYIRESFDVLADYIGTKKN